MLVRLTMFMCRCSCCRSGGSGCWCLRPVLEQCDDQTTEQASALGTQHGTTTCNSLMVVPWIWEESAGHSTWQSNLQQVGGCVVDVKKKTLGTQHGTTTCKRLMVVPWILRGKHWGTQHGTTTCNRLMVGCSMNIKRKTLGTQQSKQLATVWCLCHEY